MRTKAVVIVIDDLMNLSKKRRRPSWCQWGREMEGIVKESSFSRCVEHVNLWIKEKKDPVDASRGEKWRDCEGN